MPQEYSRVNYDFSIEGPTARKQDLGDGLKIASRIWEMASKKAGYGRWENLWDAGEEVFVKW